MNKVQQNKLDKAMETIRLLGFEDNLSKYDQAIIKEMKDRKLHPFTVIETKDKYGDVVVTDYLYMSEEDDLVSIVSFVEFLNALKDGECYSFCISDMNYGGELGLIGVELINGIWCRAW